MAKMNEKSAKGMATMMSSLSEVGDIELDLTKEEKVRSMSLMMAIRYHVDTIIDDPRYLELMMQREKEAKFSNDDEERARWHLSPTTIRKVIYIAQEMEQYLIGNRPGATLAVNGEIIEPIAPAPSDGGRAKSEVQSNE